MRRTARIFLTILTAWTGLHAAAQAASSTAPAATGKVTSASIWKLPQDFLTKAHAACDKLSGGPDFDECFIKQMPAQGAPAAAVDFTRMLYKQSDGQIGIMSDFKSFGVVDAAQVFYPLRANTNDGLLLVNGDPKILDVDDLQKLDRAAMEQNSFFKAIKVRFPDTDIWPGDRGGAGLWPRVQPLPDGGTEFVVSYPLINGCHACRHVGLARFGWEFDASGKFLKTVYIPTPPPPRILHQPRAKQQSPDAGQPQPAPPASQPPQQ